MLAAGLRSPHDLIALATIEPATGAELMDEKRTLGCIGLGVMGAPICGHGLRRSGCRVVGSTSAP